MTLVPKYSVGSAGRGVSHEEFRTVLFNKFFLIHHKGLRVGLTWSIFFYFREINWLDIVNENMGIGLEIDNMEVLGKQQWKLKLEKEHIE